MKDEVTLRGVGRMRWVIGRIVVAVMVLGLVLGMVSATAGAQAPERLVLAFYYTWFDENSWGANKVPDMPLETYASRERSVMARHIDQAKGAGIDAFVVSWLGPRVDNNQTETNFRAMLDEAAARGFRLAVDFEVTSQFLGNAGEVQAALATLLATHAQHPAYLRSDGKPVIFFWRQQRFSIETWAAIRAAVDPGHNSVWIEEGTDVSPLSVFDGHHLYSVTWANRTDMSYTANKFARLVRGKAAALGAPKVYVATVMPGYDDRKTGRGSAFAVGREDGGYYERSWQAAIGSSPDWIVITSFNEWPEGTYIEPSRAYGGRYLELTSQWAPVFRSSAPPPAVVQAPTLPPAAPTQPAAAAPARPTPTRQPPTPTPAPTPTQAPEPPETIYQWPGGIPML